MTKILVNKQHSLTGHQDCVYAIERGGEPPIFFSSGGDGVVALWDMQDPENGKMVAKIPNSVYALCFYAARNLLVIGQNFEGIHLVDVDSKEKIASLKLLKSAIFDIKVFEELIFVAFGDGTLQVLDLKTLQTVKVVKPTDKSARTIAIHEKERHLAVGYSDHKVRIYALNDWQLLYTVEAHQNSVFTVRYDPEGRYLISGGRDAHLKVWDVAGDYRLKESIVAHMYAINHVDYSPDGKHFVSCSMDKSIKVWDAKTFKLLKVIDKSRHAGHGTSVNKLLWSDYNNLLVSGSDDRSISIWDINFNS